MPDPIRPLRSYTSNYRPTSAELAEGELAVNWADGIIFTKTPASNIVAWQFGVSASTASGTTGTTSTLAAIATSGSASDLATGTLPALRLPATTVTAGTYGSASAVPVYTVDSTGRLTSATSTAIAIAAGAVSGLSAVATSGSAADLTGTLSASRLPATTVTAGSYGSASSVATYTVDAAGRLTAAGSTAIAISAGAVSGLASVATSGSYADLTNKPTIPTAYTLPNATTSTLGGVIVGTGLSVTSGTVSANVTSVVGRTGAVIIAAADVSGLGSLATQSGTFSGTSSGTNTGDQTITLTGDVTGSGTGTFAATLAASGVTAGTYTSVTVDAKGRVTAGTNPTSSGGGGVKLGLILALQ